MSINGHRENHDLEHTEGLLNRGSTVTVETGFPVSTPNLPGGYFPSTLILMTRDPDELFANWEFTPAQLAHAKAQRVYGEEYREVIRLSWPPRSLFDVNFTFLPVSFDSRRANLRVPYPGFSYRAEIGWLGSNGDFIPILVSNQSATIEHWGNASPYFGGCCSKTLNKRVSNEMDQKKKHEGEEK